jgi:hypothetical protein
MTNNHNNKIKNAEQPKAIFWVLLVVICLCLFSYGYMVRASIVNIVERQDMEKEVASLGSRVLMLESEYVKVKNNVTLDSARALGFVAVSSQKFVDSKGTKTAGLSVNLR